MAANPNTIPLRTTWTKEYQLVYDKMPVYPAVTSHRLAPNLEKGDIVKRTYPRQFIAKTTGGDGAFTRQVIVDTEETLTINQEKDAGFYIKSLDEIQSHLPTRTRYAQENVKALHRDIDANVLAEYSNMTNALDAASFSGTATYGITVTPTNVAKLFSSVGVLLNMANVYINIPMKFTGNKLNDAGQNMPVAVISPQVYAQIVERKESKDTIEGDNVGKNGYCGKYFGYNLFVSNALTWTGTLKLATNPTNTDTITIMGVTFTFVSSIGSTAGNVLIGAAATDTRDNIVTLITTPGTTTATGVALSSTPDSNGFSDQDRFTNVTTVNSGTTVTWVAKGKGFCAVSSNLTAAADGWDTNLQIQHCLIGVEGAIDLVMAKEPSLDERKRDGYLGYDVVAWMAYGIKTFNDGKGKLVDVKVLTSAYTGDDSN